MDPERRVGDALRNERSLVGVADPSHAAVGGGEDDGRHVLQMTIAQQSDVLEVVRLFDMADGLLDSPPGDVRGHDLPEVFPRRRPRKGCQEHHRLLSESLHDDHVHQLVADVREPYRNDAVVQLDVDLLPVRVECDRVRITHDALVGEVVAQEISLPADDVAAFEPDDEIHVFP